MIFSELFTENKGVCNTMFNIDNTRAAALFGDITDEEKNTIDGFINFNIGEKILNSKICKLATGTTDIDAARVAAVEFFTLEKYDKLLKDKNDLLKELDPLANNTRVSSITKTENRDNNESGTAKETTKIFGFDSVSASDKGENDNENTRNETLKIDTTFSKSTSENTTGRSTVSLMNEKLKYNKNVFYDFLLNDVSDFFTLDIY